MSAVTCTRIIRHSYIHGWLNPSVRDLTATEHILPKKNFPSIDPEITHLRTLLPLLSFTCFSQLRYRPRYKHNITQRTSIIQISRMHTHRPWNENPDSILAIPKNWREGNNNDRKSCPYLFLLPSSFFSYIYTQYNDLHKTVSSIKDNIWILWSFFFCFSIINGLFEGSLLATHSVS